MLLIVYMVHVWCIKSGSMRVTASDVINIRQRRIRMLLEYSMPL
jgi:hypothetical protein